MQELPEDVTDPARQAALIDVNAPSWPGPESRTTLPLLHYTVPQPRPATLVVCSRPRRRRRRRQMHSLEARRTRAVAAARVSLRAVGRVQLPADLVPGRVKPAVITRLALLIACRVAPALKQISWPGTEVALERAVAGLHAVGPVADETLVAPALERPHRVAAGCVLVAVVEGDEPKPTVCQSFDSPLC